MPSTLRSLTLPAICGLYLAYRIGLLATQFDAVSIPCFELGIMGNVAHLWSSGSAGVPLHTFYDNCGGHLTTGLLAVPLYWLFGGSYLALKLVPLLLGLGSLLLIWFVMERVFGRRAAVLAALLFALAPPTLLKYSVLAKGNHFENLFFQLAALALFVQAHRRPAERRWLLAFGFAAAFSIWFYFGSAILMLALLAVHVLRRSPRGALGDARWVVPGCAVGALPLAWIHWTTAGRELSFLTAKFPPRTLFDPQRIARRISELWGEALPAATVFEDLGAVSGPALDALFFATALTASLALMPRVKRALTAARRGSLADAIALALWSYLPAFTLLYALSTFDFDVYNPPVEVGRYRYLVPHLTFSLLLIAIAAAGAEPTGFRWRIRGRRLLAAFSLALGATGFGVLVPSPDWVGTGRAYAGHHLRYVANVLMRKHSRDPVTHELVFDYERILMLTAGLSGSQRREVLLGVGYYAAWVQLLPDRHPQGREFSIEPILEPFPESDRPDLARGVGSCLRRLVRLDAGARERLRAILAAPDLAGHRMAGPLVEGLCVDFGFVLSRRSRRALDESLALLPLVPPRLHEPLKRGLGQQCGELFARGVPRDAGNVRAVTRALRGQADADFWFGAGRGVALARAARGASLSALSTWVPSDMGAAFFSGARSLPTSAARPEEATGAALLSRARSTTPSADVPGSTGPDQD